VQRLLHRRRDQEGGIAAWAIIRPIPLAGAHRTAELVHEVVAAAGCPYSGVPD
jgi:hypothetical protein